MRLYVTLIFIGSLVYSFYWGLLYQPAPFDSHSRLISVNTLDYPRFELNKALKGDESALSLCLSYLQKTIASHHCSPQPVLGVKKDKPLLQFGIIAQSHAAATIALALSCDGQLLAIPKALRQQTQWHSEAKMKSVPFSFDQADIEKLYIAKPTLCLASTFSNPNTLTKLHQLGLQVQILPPTNTLNDIWQSIDLVGHSLGQQRKANLLQMLCVLSTQWLAQELKSASTCGKRFVILELHRHFSLPSTRNVYMRWVSENFNLFCIGDKEQWSVPIDYESLHALRPDCIILLCDDPQGTQKKLIQDPQWQKLMLVSKAKVSLVPYSCLHSPSQLIVLGLYDLVAAIKSFCEAPYEN